MTLKQNIASILECHFSGFKDELIEACVQRIMEQIERQADTPQTERDRPQGCKGCKHWIYRSNFGEDCEFDDLENCKYEPKDGR